MTAAIANLLSPPPPSALPPAVDAFTPRQQFALSDVSWDYYQQTVRALERSRVRVTFDRGSMELMSPSIGHEMGKTLAARLIELYSLEADIPVYGAGSVTCQREDLENGLEPDECYYVSTPAPPPVDAPLDLAVYAPPDLAIEVDVTNSSIPREPIYAAMGVPEVWRLNRTGVTPLLRNKEGTYEPSASSRAFPRLDMLKFNHFLQMALTHDQHSVLKMFRDWVRSTLNM